VAPTLDREGGQDAKGMGVNHRVGLGWLLLLAGGVLGSGLLTVRPASSDASGCTFYDESTPLNDSSCGYPGDGCYECEYSQLGQPGYLECAENPDGTGAHCRRVMQPYHQSGPSVAASIPVSLAQNGIAFHIELMDSAPGRPLTPQ
jgi:hypothetical protein